MRVFLQALVLAFTLSSCYNIGSSKYKTLIVLLWNLTENWRRPDILLNSCSWLRLFLAVLEGYRTPVLRYIYKRRPEVVSAKFQRTGYTVYLTRYSSGYGYSFRSRLSSHVQHRLVHLGSLVDLLKSVLFWIAKYILIWKDYQCIRLLAVRYDNPIPVFEVYRQNGQKVSQL
jgi:hypothetical protein